VGVKGKQFYDVTSYSLVDMHQRLGGTCLSPPYLYHEGDSIFFPLYPTKFLHPSAEAVKWPDMDWKKGICFSVGAMFFTRPHRYGALVHLLHFLVMVISGSLLREC
jgi:hypothetical protein